MRGAEIGVFRGHSAVRMLSEFPTLFLFLVDSFDEKHFFKSFEVNSMREAELEAIRNIEPYDNRVHFLRIDSLVAAEIFEDEYLDFIYLDASHLYEAVKKDLIAWPRKVRPGGIVMGHDYDGRGDNMRRNPFGVKKAVDEHAYDIKCDLSVHRGHVWAYIK